jgi:hypothetical protein
VVVLVIIKWSDQVWMMAEGNYHTKRLFLLKLTMLKDPKQRRTS